PCPRSLIRTQSQDALQAQRADPALLGGHEPHCSKPSPQRSACAVENRSSGDRGASPTCLAHPQALAGPPELALLARRTHETLRPPQAGQVVQARGVVAEPLQQIRIRARIVHPRPWVPISHELMLLHLSRYPERLFYGTRRR